MLRITEGISQAGHAGGDDSAVRTLQVVPRTGVLRHHPNTVGGPENKIVPCQFGGNPDVVRRMRGIHGLGSRSSAQLRHHPSWTASSKPQSGLAGSVQMGCTDAASRERTAGAALGRPRRKIEGIWARNPSATNEARITAMFITHVRRP